MKKDKDQIATRDKENQDALNLKRAQDKVRKKFEYLESVDAKEFQAEYVKAQAKEICDYLQYLRLTPLQSWYSKQLEIISDPIFMHNHFLKKNEYEEIVPDLERISKLVLPEADTEDNPTVQRDFISE